MPLFPCPECKREISDRADACPHCGLPARYFSSLEIEKSTAFISDNILVDLADLRNVLISFYHSYQTLFGAGHYITAREIIVQKNTIESWAEQLSIKQVYDYCTENASHFAVDMEIVNNCLRRYETLNIDAESHNTGYIDDIVKSNKDYFDGLLKEIDPNIMLDDERSKQNYDIKKNAERHRNQPA